MCATGSRRFLAAVMRLTRAVTTVRSAIALLNGVMMSTIAVICVMKWSAGGISTGVDRGGARRWCSG